MQNPLFYLVKKLLSFFPTSWPFKIYNALLKVPLLKGCVGLAIRWLTPDFVDIPEGRVLFDKDDPVMSGAISLGKYEPETIALFRSYLKEDMVVVDIGANLGYFTVIAAGLVGPSGNVFSYEPDPRNFALLEKNISVNNFTQVKAIPKALSDRAGTRELFFVDNQATLSFGDKKQAGRSESVTTDTLDSSLKAMGSPHIDLIKMDIEGAEPLALEGMQETIANNPNLIIFFEFHPNAIERVGRSPLSFLKRFTELGFSLSAVDEDNERRIRITNIAAFADSFQGKERSQNLIAVKTSRFVRTQKITKPQGARSTER